jgi:predicted metal-binding membrane protein
LARRHAAIGVGMPTGSWFMPIAGLLTVTAWAALWLWEQSPYGRYLDHGRWTEIGFAAAICRAVPGGDFALPLLLYAGGWLLMIAAMMLPTVLPLLRLFERLVHGRPDRGQLVALLICGYLLAWAGFGVAAHLLDLGLHETARRTEWLTAYGWAIGVAVLAIAGLFQFSRLKYRCLDKVPHPVQLSVDALAWTGAIPQQLAAWAASRPLLRRLLLGDHAADVRRRHRQCRVDAAARGCYGAGEERKLG